MTRELISKVGEPLLKENLDKEYTRLELLDIFIEIQIEPIVAEDGIILTYRFTETLPWLPMIGFQITDENGISAGGGLKFPNLFGKNIFFSGRVLFGGATSVQIKLENPWFAGDHLGYELEYYRRERDNQIGDFYEKSNEFYLRVGSHLGKNSRIGGSLESVNIHSDKDGVTLSPNNVDRVTRIGLYVSYDSRDVFVDTHKGWWNEVSFSREIRIFKNATDFYQLDLDLRRYQPLPFWDRHTLAVFSLLTLRSGEVGKDIAPWQRFGVGGTNTVRGWEYATQRGKNQFVNTLEYRITVLEPQVFDLPFNLRYRAGLDICFFGDMGIAWDEADQFKTRNFIGGFGVGVRILVPIVGVTRLDVGWGQKGKGIFLHLGAYEKPVMSRKRVR
ncbi:MAG: BamA/TamA family outer membrane protein [Candidatus Aminicenantes bacterium]|nr:MAG: BamA/TamA family outer membrane protein [Candidatus Aminicenantes bacterium]